MDLFVTQIKQKNILSHCSCIPSVIVLIVNLTRSMIIWEELPMRDSLDWAFFEGLSSLC